MKQREQGNALFILTVLAAIVYNSWPLGYVLSKQTAHYGLASDLEKVAHPYFWLFIAGDVLCGICLIVVSGYIRLKLWDKFKSREWEVVLLGLFIFGLFTAIDALLPTDCSISSVLQCTLKNQGGLGIDALLSFIACFGIFLSLVTLSFSRIHPKKGQVIETINKVTLVGWLVSGLFFIWCVLTNRNVHNIELLLITLTGISIGIIGFNIRHYLLLIKLDNKTKPE